MRYMYSHPGEYRKIFLANYLYIGFVPGGNSCESACPSMKVEVSIANDSRKSIRANRLRIARATKLLNIPQPFVLESALVGHLLLGGR